MIEEIEVSHVVMAVEVVTKMVDVTKVMVEKKKMMVVGT